jgi:hypothetical protein
MVEDEHGEVLTERSELTDGVFCGVPFGEDEDDDRGTRAGYSLETYTLSSGENVTVTTFSEVHYTMAFHQAVLLFMGEGLAVQTDWERNLSSGLMVLGALTMAYIFGEVNMNILSFNASKNMFQKKMTDLYESMEALHLPQNLQER